jgi:protein-tyrosine phosphatase
LQALIAGEATAELGHTLRRSIRRMTAEDPFGGEYRPVFLAVDGLMNLRDLGGYPVTGGGRTRAGMVYRSESLHGVTALGLETLRSFGLVTVIDLRSTAERDLYPGPLETVHVEVQEQATQSDRFDVFGLSGRTAGETMLRDLYFDMVDQAAPQFGRILSLLADRARIPALIHCAGGKDRTGITIALMLLALGVDREIVLDDYAAPSVFPEREVRRMEFHARFVERGIESEAALGMLSTPRWAMAEALDRIDETFGGVVPYLLGPAGMSEAQLAALRAELID